MPFVEQQAAIVYGSIAKCAVTNELKIVLRISSNSSNVCTVINHGMPLGKVTWFTLNVE